MKIVLTDLGLEAYETTIGRNKTEEINKILDLNLERENGDAADQVDNQQDTEHGSNNVRLLKL